jgi:hypothetical protein
VAFWCTRGLPAHDGGFETAREEVSKRFVERNQEVAVGTENRFGVCVRGKVCETRGPFLPSIVAKEAIYEAHE